MNKNQEYQEALTNLKTYIVDYDDEYDEDIYLYESYKEEFDLLQELVNKEKPMLVQKTREITYNPKSYGTRTLKIECPNCKKAFHIVFDNEYKYCPNCGQKLDWSDNDE